MILLFVCEFLIVVGISLLWVASIKDEPKRDDANDCEFP